MAKKLFNKYFCIVVLFCFSAACFAQFPSDGWFPLQKAPKTVAKTIVLTSFESLAKDGVKVSRSFGADHMLAQSVSGLAALAVNEDRFDEMVWISDQSPDYMQWYRDSMKRIKFKEQGPFTPWQLVKRYKDKGIFDGYILYSYDTNDGHPWGERETMDISVNVATSVAGILKGILIEESQEARAKEMGLKKLLDARGKTMSWCYQKYRNKMNRRLLLTVDPKAPYNRAYAIANRCAAVFGVGEDTEQFCKWLEAPSAILGWNCGDELRQTGLVTEYGHFQTATNWALNLPLLSADAQTFKPVKIKSLDPKKINFADKRHPVSFVMSDGDNVQWMVTNFFFRAGYWTNPQNGKFPMGWSGCPSHLVQLCPDIYSYMQRTKPSSATIIEYGAGYHYPDLLGAKRSNRKEILRKRATRISSQLKKSGVNVFGFICKDVASEDALEAYKIYADEIEGLIGMMAFQYYPYNGGMGKVYWVKNKDGTDIPVITATHSQWTNARWENGGDPFQIAKLINDSLLKPGDKPDYSLSAVHAWSRFQHPDNKALADEANPRGLTPVLWCVENLSDQTQVVSVEELIWRIRMKYQPAQTKKYLSN